MTKVEPQAAMHHSAAVVQNSIPAAIQNATRVARSMHGKPYRWGGSGPSGTDCSGFMAYITRALRMEGNPYHRIGTTSTFPWPGFRPGLHSAFGVGNDNKNLYITNAAFPFFPGPNPRRPSILRLDVGITGQPR